MEHGIRCRDYSFLLPRNYKPKRPKDTAILFVLARRRHLQFFNTTYLIIITLFAPFGLLASLRRLSLQYRLASSTPLIHVTPRPSSSSTSSPPSAGQHVDSRCSRVSSSVPQIRHRRYLSVLQESSTRTSNHDIIRIM